MRTILILAAALAGCGGGEEAGFAPNAVSDASVGEAQALNEAEAVLGNRTLAPVDPPPVTKANPNDYLLEGLQQDTADRVTEKTPEQ